MSTPAHAEERNERRFEALTSNTQLYLEYLRTSLVLLTAGMVFVGFTRRRSADARVDFAVLLATATVVLVVGAVGHWKSESEIERGRYPRRPARYQVAATSAVVALLYVSAGVVFFMTWGGSSTN